MNKYLKKITSLLLVVVASVLLIACGGTTTYKVEFDLNGAPGEIASQTIESGEKVTKPADPNWDGYTFEGWYSDQTLGTEYYWYFSINTVTKNITLYASWQEVDKDDDDEPIVIIPSMPDLSVRSATGEFGMVATASSYATDVGVEILKAGGNAFDAAVAVSFALGVVEPNASGIGGGGFMVAYNSDTDQRLSYNYREFAPEMSDRTLYTGAGGKLEFGDGAGSFGVPMFVDGLITILDEQGTMSLEEVMLPAINLAEYGFPITASLAQAISDNFTKIMRPTSINEALDIYTDGLSPLKEGDILINKNLAKVLRKISREGKEGFYKGDVARAIVNSVSAGGSVVTMDDLANAIGRTKGFQAQTPVTGTYKDFEFISMAPPSSGGATIIEFFNMLEYYENELVGGIKGLGHNTADYIHLIGSVTQLATGDRRKYIGDPNFVDVPVQGLINKEYAALRMENFNPLVGQTFPSNLHYGNPWAYNNVNTAYINNDFEETPQSASTTHFSIVDKFGNIVSATHTINYFFGNGYMPDGTGIHLNNIMSPFSINENSVNLIEPFKVPLSNMSPLIILKDGEPYMSIGSPGSMRILSAIVQTVLNIIEFDMDIQSAIESPRVHHYVGKEMEIEGAIGQDVIDQLIVLGYDPIVYRGVNLYFGGVQGVLIDLENDKLYGGADPRRDGKAGGY